MQVLGGHQHRLHPSAHVEEDRHDDLHHLAGLLPRLHRPPAGLEGPQLGAADTRQKVPDKPGPLLPDLRDGIVLLPPATGHPHTVLANIPDGQETHPETAGDHRRNATGREESSGGGYSGGTGSR